jgi:predicted protein tyrosine phosphatase
MTEMLWQRTTISGLRQLDNPDGHDFIISLIDPDWPEPRQFDAWPIENRLLLKFYDETSPISDKIIPSTEIVETILTFGRERSAADGSRVFIHCLSGVSRSTAAAVILWAQKHPDVSSEKLFSVLASCRPNAWPNSLMLKIADELLDRKDSLTKAGYSFFRRSLDEESLLEERMIRLRRQSDIDGANALIQRSN